MSNYYDESYPPDLMLLPNKYDLDLVGDVLVVGELNVRFTFDSDGRDATIDYGDGTPVTVVTSPVQHAYAANGIYTVTVRSPKATDSAVIDLSAADAPPEADGEPPPEETISLPLDES